MRTSEQEENSLRTTTTSSTSSSSTTSSKKSNSSFNRQNQSAFNGSLKRFDYSMNEIETDLFKVLSDFTEIMENDLTSEFHESHGIKVSLTITIQYKSKIRKDVEPFDMYLRSSNYLINTESDIKTKISSIGREIQTRNENLVRNESNVGIHRIFYLSVFCTRFNPLAAAGFAELPQFLKRKHAIVNIQNPDNRCFGYAVLAALHPAKQNPNRHNQYKPLFKQHGLDELKYPISPNDIPEIEKKLKLRINIFSFFDDEGKGRYPLYISQNMESDTEIDLLYWNEHYAWIKSFSNFIYDLGLGHRTKFYCKKCFGLFRSEVTFQRHKEICDQSDVAKVIYSFPSQGTILKFKNTRFMTKTPFVIYADFESLLLPINAENKHNKRTETEAYQYHQPCAAAFYVVSQYEEIYPNHFESFTGKDVVEWFVSQLLKVTKEITEIMENVKPIEMTPEDWNSFNQETICCICQKPFDEYDPANKVRDHDHLTGKYRGAAHMNCNLQFSQSHQIPVFMHNFKGYDSHIITLILDKFKTEKLHIIGQGMEKYLTLTIGSTLVFKDSYQFMSLSLERLAIELLQSGKERFAHIHKNFSRYPDEQIDLLLRKGIYPYEYMDDWEKLNEPQLPTIEMFFNSLTQNHCDPTDYAHAKKCWEIFECKTMNDYQDLYLKLDVIILADIFENFRKFSLKHYRLDPAHFVSAPQLSWDAMLLHTSCELELISDPEIFNLIDRGIRGGVAMIVTRYAKANNVLITGYDQTKANSHIYYFDANNLYGYAMSCPLPQGNFKWLREDEWKIIDWKGLTEEQSTGYIIECDLEYPPALHDLHSDYPLAPEKRYIEYEMLNDLQIKLLVHYQVPKSGIRCQKLIPHFLPRFNYVIHYQNLKFYLEEGMILKRIHKVLEFKQTRWLAPYIIKNQVLRAEAKSEFEKSQPKLFNNSIYGKTVENQKKRTNIKLVNNKKECKRLIEKPQMTGFKIFSEDLAAINLRRVKAKIDKPFYVGFTVLELSKLHMYKFHYRYIKKTFGNTAKLLFTDTDSLMYHITGENIYDQFFRDKEEYFDFSNHKPESKYYFDGNKAVIGKMKDEAAGQEITEFVGLRPKMYSFLIENEQGQINGKNRAKGIQYAVAKKIPHQEYLDQLGNPHENRQENRRIGTKLHRLYSIKTKKRGLCSFDDKRLILDDNITTLPYGHYKFDAKVEVIGRPENEISIRSHRFCLPISSTLKQADPLLNESDSDDNQPL